MFNRFLHYDIATLSMQGRCVTDGFQELLALGNCSIIMSLALDFSFSIAQTFAFTR
jgi:hypothetical protein